MIFINKQEKMKISDLRNSIKEMIVDELSEAVAYDVVGSSGKKTTQSFPSDAAAKEFDAKNSNVTLSKLEEKTSDPVVTQLIDIEKQIKFLEKQRDELQSSLDINETNNISEDVNFTFQGELTPAGEVAQEFIKNNPEIKGGKLVKALSNDEEFQKALEDTEKITKKPQKDIFQNQTQKFYDLVMGNRELGQRGRKANPDTIAKKSEKPTTGAPTIKKEPSEKITKMKSIPEPKGVKLSDDEKEAYQRVMSKVDQIKNGTATKRDKQILVQLYGDPYVKGILKKAGTDLIDMIKDLKSSLD